MRPQTGRDMKIAVQQKVIEGKIYIIQGHKVMLDSDLAEHRPLSDRFYVSIE